MQPFGNGPYSPVASNDSEDGRTLNRRVELVKQ
jgi:outer membrane protein OmpA-like peptidoglycan-associated protein